MMVEIEQICVGEDALENNQTPTNTDPNSEIEQSCEAHKLSPKTDLEGTQYEEEFPPLSKESLTATTDDFPSQKFNSDAHTLSFEKEMDGTLSPTIIGDDETISDPSLRKKIFPPVTNIAGNDQTTTGPILHSFEVDGQHYEIRSYEEAETSNLREEPNDFQDVQNKLNKKAGKRGTAPRTIKTRSYDPNLEVGTVSEITRYWPSRKSTTMEKIVTTKSYSGPFWYVGPVGPIGADGKRPKKIMPRNLALDQHPGRSQVVSHLAFADDLIVFLKGDLRNILRFKHILLNYLRASRQEINNNKSKVFCKKSCHWTYKNKLEKALGFMVGSPPFKYLGSTITSGKLKRIHCEHILNHFDAYLNSWYSKELNPMSRLILIKHVLSVIPLHTLAVQDLPKSIINIIQGKLANFFWGTKLGKSKHHWAKWTALCKPTGEGGLGLRSLEDLQKACALKLWWKVINANSLWSNFVKDKYYMDGLFETKLYDSASWKRICRISTIGLQNTYMTSSTPKWINGAYWAVRDRDISTRMNTLIWNKFQIPKIKLFTWKAIHHFLPFPNILRKLSYNLPSKCPFCAKEEVTDQHILLTCILSQQIWKAFADYVGEPNWSQGTDLSNYMLQWWENYNKYTIRGLLKLILPGCIIWNLWKAYNRSIYEERNITNMGIIIEIQKLVQHWYWSNKKVQKIATDEDIQALNLKPYLSR
ncbi:unnamed protein product [Cuscuta campestris]|uniref:Reverse transcriptase zinc-binding domain-containing protein n=1 Tax=Cuscuta campestris TaxID=132261 RepID=A0A484MY43_9ASTE|nr:unnamed protein product [Cuscuta campestris]